MIIDSVIGAKVGHKVNTRTCRMAIILPSMMVTNIGVETTLFTLEANKQGELMTMTMCTTPLIRIFSIGSYF